MSEYPLLLVVPCFNEETRLPTAAFAEGLARDPALALRFVDDGSTDGTKAVLDDFALHHPERVTVQSLPKNAGKAEAVRRGMLEGLALRPRWLGYWDADLATPLAEASSMAEVLAEDADVDLVIGARIRMLGRTIERHVVRHHAGRIIATFASSLLHLPVYDTQCGAKIFRVKDNLPELFEQPFVSGWLFDVEVLARMQKRAAAGRGRDPAESVVEWPLSEWRDVEGSKVRPIDSFRAFRDLWRIRRALPWSVRRPRGGQ